MAEVRSTIPIANTEPEEDYEPVEYEIATYPADYTLAVLSDRWEAKQIIIPDFQRSYVWTRKQASRLIESFLLGLPVPAIFLYRDARSQRLLVVDGHQRLASIVFFRRGVFRDDRAFRLEDVNPRWNGKTFRALSEPDQLRFLDSILRATIIQQLNPADNSSVYLMFERLNAGGTKLNHMEIRKALNMEGGYQLLEALNRDQNWRTILGRSKPDPRLRDAELILRVLALARRWRDYERPMKRFLDEYIESLDGPDAADQREEDADFFRRACDRVVRLLPERAFYVRTRVNLAALDSAMAAIGAAPEDHEAKIPEAYSGLRANAEYEEAIRFNTSDKAVVLDRFQMAWDALVE